MCGISSDQFDRFSRQVLEQRNAGDLGLAVVAHPIGGIPASVARERSSREPVDALLELVHGATEPVEPGLVSAAQPEVVLHVTAAVLEQVIQALTGPQNG